MRLLGPKCDKRMRQEQPPLMAMQEDGRGECIRNSATNLGGKSHP